MIAGYARVSRIEQHPDLQVDALRAAGCERIWVEHASGGTGARPELNALLDHLRPGDTLVVWRLDRLGRSLRHLLAVITDLGERGIEFRSVTEGMDTTTPNGRLLFAIFGAVAEFERELLRERTLAGLAAARANGRSGGRPRVLTGVKHKAALEMYGRHLPVSEISATLGVSRTTVYRAIAAEAVAS